MIYKINHRTIYSFSEMVFLEPHQLRFLPLSLPYRQIKEFKVDISPKPKGISLQIDPENNLVHHCWFEGMTRELNIFVEMKVENQEINPFNFLIYPPEYTNIPFSYTDNQKKILNNYLIHEDINPSLSKYVEKFIKDNNSETIPSLLSLTRRINLDFKIKSRESGFPNSPDTTFKDKLGSCRDLAWMELQVLRKLGIATRFVSGYYYVQSDQPAYELHAWIEVFIPGAGWFGLDPTAGMVAVNNYVPVASSYHYSHTYPVIGTIRGEANSDLRSSLSIEID